MSRLSVERISELWEETGGITGPFARAIESEAYKQGQERMRERARLVALNHYDELIAGFIRNLEIEEPK